MANRSLGFVVALVVLALDQFANGLSLIRLESMRSATSWFCSQSSTSLTPRTRVFPSES